MKIKREMLFNYQIKIADLYNIATSKAEKPMPIFFVKEKHVFRYETLQLYLRPRLKLKKMHRVLEFN